TIIYMGNLNKMRGYKMILDTMKIVHAKHPEFFCHIIGWMDYTGIDASIPRLNTRETDSMGIRYTPPVGVMEMPRFLKQASVCWLPWQRSMNHEFGTPIKLFEYMATGRPVVCSRMGIISTVVNETGCGLLVQPDDPQAHAEALIYLLTHPEEAAQMGACGREWVVARYNWSVEEKKLLAFYDQLSRQNGVTEREGVVYDHGR
ncbi:MAG TPA: glycosyltransferase, partial [Bacteroidota bacterium]|nr:glycosyltransferase [Bacteroidota bacterium]